MLGRGEIIFGSWDWRFVFLVNALSMDFRKFFFIISKVWRDRGRGEGLG